MTVHSKSTSISKFVTVLVEESDDLPEGCCLRFKVVSDPRPVLRVRYAREGAASSPRDDAAVLEGAWRVESPEDNDSVSVPWGATVEDSGAGTCTLVYGGSRGLRLRPEGGGDPIAEPYLLLAHEAIVEWGQ